MLPLEEWRIIAKIDYQKNNIILWGDFNITLGNKDRSTTNKSFCESGEERMSLITEFDLEGLLRSQNPNRFLYTHFHGKGNTYSRINRAYTSTNLRVGVKIDHKISTFTNHFQTTVIKRKPRNFNRGKTGYWTVGYFKIKNTSNI